MNQYAGVPIRRLPAGPEHLTHQTRYKEKWLYNPIESDRKMRQKEKEQTPDGGRNPFRGGWSGNILHCPCGRSIDLNSKVGKWSQFDCACGRDHII